jgi:hypothetical protein
VARKNLKTQISKLDCLVQRNISILLANRKAASVVLSTIILTAGVLAMGVAVLYWATSMGDIARNKYSTTVADDSVAIQERLGYEYVTYSSNTLTVYLINWGRTNDTRIARVYVWDVNHNLLGSGTSFELGITPASLLTFMGTTNTTAIPSQSLNMGDEGKFTITFPQGSPTPYSIRIVTERGRNFDYSSW